VQNIQGSMKKRKDDRRLSMYKGLKEIFVVLQYKGSWFFHLILVSQVIIFSEIFMQVKKEMDTGIKYWDLIKVRMWGWRFCRSLLDSNLSKPSADSI
jgi:hypothetical protein